MASSKCNERHDALFYLTSKMPLPLVLELVSLGLDDRSKLVRQAAPVKCSHLGLKQLLPELERRAICEPDAWVKELCLYHARMLRRTVTKSSGRTEKSGRVSGARPGGHGKR
jgi:hypothetical protein